MAGLMPSWVARAASERRMGSLAWPMIAAAWAVRCQDALVAAAGKRARLAKAGAR